MPLNMKTYLPTLLFFFLFLDTSESALLGSGLVKILMRGFKSLGKEVPKEMAETAVERTVEAMLNHKDHLPSPEAPPEKIKDLHLFKEYLYNYGYIQSPNSDSFTDYLDQETVSAIKNYQLFFNLPVTGSINEETRQQVSLLRCAVPDMNFTYEDLTTSNNVSWPLGTKWFPNRSNLTYGFAPANQLLTKVITVFQDSFKRWSDAIGVLNLTETTYDAANIKIGFYIFNKAVGAEVVGGTVIKLQSDVTYGNMRLDADRFRWLLPTDNVTTTSWKRGEVDLESVVMHQIGHLLGLTHSSREDSVMYPCILPSLQRKVQLSGDDKEQIQQVYLFP